jgi:hypothetical protein
MLIENPEFPKIFPRFATRHAYSWPGREDLDRKPHYGGLSGLGHTAQKAGLINTT